MEGFLIRGWDLVAPGCGDTSMLAREATLSARWFYEPHPISDQATGGWTYTSCGAILTRGIAFVVPGLLESLIYERTYYPGMGPYPLQVRRDLDVGSRGNSPRALALCTPANQRLSDERWSCRTVRDGIDPGILFLSSGC